MKYVNSKFEKTVMGKRINRHHMQVTISRKRNGGKRYMTIYILFGFLREDVARWHVGWKVRNVNCFWVAGAGSKCLSICQECERNDITLPYSNSPCINVRRAVLAFNGILSKEKKQNKDKKKESEETETWVPVPSILYLPCFYTWSSF